MSVQRLQILEFLGIRSLDILAPLEMPMDVNPMDDGVRPGDARIVISTQNELIPLLRYSRSVHRRSLRGGLNLDGLDDQHSTASKSLFELTENISIFRTATYRDDLAVSGPPLEPGTIQLDTTLINSSDLLAPLTIHPKYDRVTASINGAEVKWGPVALVEGFWKLKTELATTAPVSRIITSTDPLQELPFHRKCSALAKQRTETSGNSMSGNQTEA
ncbi:hypothetical protein F4810DRAFT_712836 [Camillea tinctor]|nr:hypothetical protein F4810DRAFT_712836 [Camillea tinctor]